MAMQDDNHFVDDPDTLSFSARRFGFNVHGVAQQPSLLLLRIGAIRLPTGRWPLGGRIDPYWRLYVNSPGSWILQDGHQLPLQAHCRYLIPPWTHLHADTKQACDHCFAHFATPWLSRSMAKSCFPTTICLPDRPGAAMNSASVRALGRASCQDQGPGIAQLTAWQAVIAQSFAEACQQMGQAEQEMLQRASMLPEPLPSILQFIDHELHRAISIDELAQLARCSSGHLSRLFKSHLSSSPLAFIQERRITQAARLLLAENHSIEQIAAAVGFQDRHYFSRVFAKLMGIGPAGWRRSQER